MSWRAGALAGLTAAVLSCCGTGSAIAAQNGRIFFSSGNSRFKECGVASVAASGIGYNCVYPGGWHPVVSADGQRIALNLGGGESALNVAVMTIKGKGARFITHAGGDGNDYVSDFAPDSRRVFYADFSRVNDQGIYDVNVDGSGERELASNGKDASPSSNGRTVVFERNGIVVKDLASGSETKILPDVRTKTVSGNYIITEHSEQNSLPRFSPDGRRIVFTRQTSDITTGCEPFPACQPVKHTSIHTDVWVANADGGGATQLTNDPKMGEADGRFSPDGTKIVYVRGVTLEQIGYGEVWVMNADGSGKHKVGEGTQPFWSTLQGGPGRLRVVVKGAPRHCLSRKQLGLLNFGIIIKTTASRYTGYTITTYVDGKEADQVVNSDEGGAGLPIYPFEFVRPHSTHKVRWVVKTKGKEVVARTVKFRRC